MSGKGILVYPLHKFKFGYLENDRSVGETVEVVYDWQLDKVFKITGCYVEGEKQGDFITEDLEGNKTSVTWHNGVRFYDLIFLNLESILDKFKDRFSDRFKK